jgi:hypothetical protein
MALPSHDWAWERKDARSLPLSDGGVLRIECDEASPSKRRYVLTDSGKRLAVLITALWQWGEEHCFQPGEAVPLLIDKATEQPLAKLEIRTADGRVVDPRDLQMALQERSAESV